MSDSMLTADWKSEIEVKARISMCKEAFNNKNNLFYNGMDLEMTRDG